MMPNGFAACRVSGQRAARSLLTATLVWLMLAVATGAWAQGCTAAATMQRQTTVFDHPATTFNTASGWVYGATVATIAPNIKVFVCSEQTVRFGVITQAWSEIAFWNGRGWQHGWVVSDNLKRAAIDHANALVASLLDRASPVSVAHAEAPLITENPPSDAAPPASPPARRSTGALGGGEDSAVLSFYAVLFVCMLVGMMGKVLFDAVTTKARIDWSARARHGIVPLLVSPMVFLGIMQAADATSAAALGSFISICCVSFQNGFFWNTIFDRARRS